MRNPRRRFACDIFLPCQIFVNPLIFQVEVNASSFIDMSSYCVGESTLVLPWNCENKSRKNETPLPQPATPTID